MQAILWIFAAVLRLAYAKGEQSMGRGQKSK